MSRSHGHAELDWSVDAIQVGHRHRTDVGDLSELCDSVQRLGLLQPITISPDGTLLCGTRRLAAVKRLGWTTVKVWVRTGISGTLERLLAERHENTVREPLGPIDGAELYRELKQLEVEDSARRQGATRFGAESKEHAGHAGGGESPPPAQGESRERAAELVTGSKSYKRLEQVSELQDLADDANASEQLRQLAKTALTEIDDDGKVHGRYATVKVAQVLEVLDALAFDDGRPESMRQSAIREAGNLRAQDGLPPAKRLKLAHEALTRANAANPTPARRRPRKRTVEAFVLMWNELSGWTEEYDPVAVGSALTDEQWNAYEATIESTIAFTEQARTVRHHPAAA